MATLRAYLADLVQDARHRWMPCVSAAGVSYDAMITASHQPTPWCLILVIAEDHAPIAALECVDVLPDLPLGTAVDSAMLAEVAALLINRGVDAGDLGWLDVTAEYRDIINGIPVNHLGWDSFDVDAYLPA